MLDTRYNDNNESDVSRDITDNSLRFSGIIFLWSTVAPSDIANNSLYWPPFRTQLSRPRRSRSQNLFCLASVFHVIAACNACD